jgi:hypothetical protein
MAESGESFAVQSILDRYTESLGGPRSVEALSSLSVEGIQIQGGKSYQFVLRKKRPDSIRYRLSADETSILCGFNGREGWQRTEVQGEVSIQDLDGDELSVLREEADFDSPLFRHMEKSWNEIKLIGKEQVGGAYANVLEVGKFGKPFARYYLNSRNGVILKCVRINADGTSGLETLYRKYRDVDGYQFAFEVENRLNGEQLSLVQIEEIEVNPGLLSFYFEKPSH